MSDARILIVEDEGIEALDLQRRLVTMGYPKPHLAFSGEEALASVAEQIPDLVLMDIMLGGELDGVATAERIHAVADVPIIYVTAYADEGTLGRARITAPYGYIVKPFRERELSIAIDMALYRYRMERRLKESERWLATTLRSIGDGVMATDRSGSIVVMNAAAERLTGWTAESVRHGRLEDVFKVDAPEPRPPWSRERPATPPGRLVSHPRLIARDGARIPIEHVISAIRDEDGTVTGEIVVFRDVTEREGAERALQAAYGELEDRVAIRTADLAQTNRHLEAEVGRRKRAEQWLSEKNVEISNRDLIKGRLLTSLGRLLGRALDKARTAPPGDAESCALLVDLLEFVRIEAGLVEVKAEPVDVAALIRVAADSFAAAARHKGLRLQAEVPERCMANTDGRLLGEILSRLTRSAIALTARGRVHLEADAAASAHPRIKVIATGELEDEQRGHLEALRHVAVLSLPATEGLELDLHLSQRLARLLAASLVVDSHYSGSSHSFILTL